MKNCLEHKDKKVIGFCLDNDCPKVAVCCLTCIKSHHLSCNEDYFVTKDDDNKMKFLPPKID